MSLHRVLINRLFLICIVDQTATVSVVKSTGSSIIRSALISNLELNG